MLGRSSPEILFVVNGLGTGGAERSLAATLPGLAAAGFGVQIVVLFAREEGVEATVRASGVRIARLQSDNAVGRVHELRQIVRRERPDIIHTSIFEADVVARVASIGLPVAVVTSLVNTSYDPSRLRDPNVGALRLRLVRSVDRFTARHFTNAFHAVTHAVKDSAVRDLKIPAVRITVVERGRDPASLGTPGAERRQRVRSSLHIRSDAPVVLNVGRHEYQKGQRFLIEAFDRVAERLDTAWLLIAGREGTSTPELTARAAASRYRERIRLLGHRNDVPDLLAAADVFAFPSLYEGTGGAMIEAMGLGLPVVATDIPSLREVAGSGTAALLVPPEDSDALSRAVLALLDDESLRVHLAAAGKRKFEDTFTIERATRRMIDFYEAVLARS